ncbi:MAG TPA: ATP-binding protein, partial [Thermoplasmata archaeon]|nr:ATP-binding protein [Thermoplasmata archaeon]
MHPGGAFEMENPFRYGTVVTGKDFVDREPELAEILKELRGGKSIVVYSNRRMGKSSLLEELARRNKKEFVFVRVDLYGMTDKNTLLNALVGETVRSAYGKAEKLASGILELVKGTTLRFVISDTGRLGVEFVGGEPKQAEMQDVLDFPEKVASKKRKRIVVVFDEFQEVGVMDGVSLLKSMRSRFQMHKNVVYVFSGSKRHLLQEIFEEAEGAFFKFARSLELGPLPREELEEFLIDRFAAANGKLEPGMAKEIVAITKGH